MKRFVAFMFAMWACPGWADTDDDIAQILGGYGCTLDSTSRAAVTEAGISELDATIRAMLSDGRAVEQGEYVVLSAEICTIRLPTIESELTVHSPEIIAITSPPDAFVNENDPALSYPGCFIDFPQGLFNRRNPTDPQKSYAEYAAFAAHGLVTGDLQFFSNSGFRVPPGLQVLAGDCAPQAMGLEHQIPSLAFISDAHFDGFIRRVAANTPCDQGAMTAQAFDFAIEIQGGVMDENWQFQPRINMLLLAEYQIIAVSAGWFGEVTPSGRHELRPPVCYYP